MATAILPPPVKSTPVDLALVQEISDLEGIGVQAALVLVQLYGEEMLAYAAQWDESTDAQKCALSAKSAITPRCPQCGAVLECRQAYIGGRGYCYVEACSGEGGPSRKRVE